MQYQNILDKIVDESKQIFGAELTGIYLHVHWQWDVLIQRKVTLT